MYRTLQNYIGHITSGKANALILCGPPGMSKTYIVRRTLHFEGYKPRADYNIESGSTLGLADTYALLYYNRKKILILDDFDTPLQDEDMINMLKSVSDTYSRRILSLPREKKLDTAKTGGEATAVPAKFEFKGKLIIITNLKREQLNPALISRAPVYEVNFNAKQVFEAIKKMIRFISPGVPEKVKWEVHDFLAELYKKNPKITIDFRVFVNAIDARVGNPESWKEMTKVIVNFGKK
jgi:replication-associated recombination protein RarA